MVKKSPIIQPLCGNDAPPPRPLYNAIIGPTSFQFGMNQGNAEIMRRTLPSTHSLACFEAVVRCGGASAAAAELNMTQSAISRRIAALEAALGEPLFVRKKRRLLPTAAAEEYARQLSGILNQVEVATTRFLSYGRKGGRLTVATPPTFGSRWLVPRLSRFIAAHPSIDINLITHIRPFNFDDAAAHLAIHFGQPNWPGTQLHYLMDENVVAVCSPALAASAKLRHPHDLGRVTLIQHTTRPDLWCEWLAHVDEGDIPCRSGPRFEYYSLVIEAAVAGIGVAILPDLLVQSEINSGTLVVPFRQRMRCRESYYVAYPQRNEANVNVVAFAQWLISECQDSVVQDRLARSNRLTRAKPLAKRQHA